MLWKWPFKPEVNVQLMWVKSPFRNDNKEWMVPLILRNNSGEIKLTEISWGLFPGFRLGQYYANGEPVEAYKSGNIRRFQIDEPEKGTLCKVSDLPDGIIDKKLLLTIKDEYLWKYDAGQIILYFPCLELVRAFLTPNATLAHALLQINGLDLIASCKMYQSSLHLIVNQTVPKGLVTKDFILHLAWLFSDPLANKTWQSIFPSIRPRGDFEIPLDLFENIVDDEELKPKKLKAKLPLTNSSLVEVRGIQKGTHFLVYEIISVGNLSLSYKDISYSKSPTIERKVTENNKPVTKINRIRKKNVLKNLGIIENPNSISKTMISRRNNNVFVFDSIPDIRRMEPIIEKAERKRSKEKPKKDEKPLESKPEQILDDPIVQERLFSGSEVLYTGNKDIHPIEFQAPSVVNNSIGYGLQPFFNAIDYLSKLYLITVVDYKVDVVPAGKPFSYNENGGPRKYALVTIKAGKETRYIVEIERFKKIYLSTLIIEPRSKKEFEDEELYEILGKLLVGLIRNHGSWNMEQLQNHPKAKIHQVKHLEKWSALEWAIALYNRLGVPEETLISDINSI